MVSPALAIFVGATDAHRAQYAIERINLEGVKKKLLLSKRRGGSGWKERRADEAIEWYRRFLGLVAQGNHFLIPTPDIDEVWHRHILSTAQYFRDCESIFGRYLHHRPSDGTPETKKRLRVNFRRTLSLYRQEFGRIPSHPKKMRFAECGEGEGDCDCG